MIRPATAADAEALASLWNPWIRDSAITFTSTEKRPEDLVQMIATRTAEGHGFLVADAGGGALLGFASYGQFRGGIGYARAMEHTIILSPEARGQGLGPSLLTALEDHARARGAHQMLAGVSGENAAGLRFHKAMGYRDCAVIPEAGYKFGRYMDLVLLQKILS